MSDQEPEVPESEVSAEPEQPANPNNSSGVARPQYNIAGNGCAVPYYTGQTYTITVPTNGQSYQLELDIPFESVEDDGMVGCVCCECGGWNEFASLNGSSSFTCWACKNGY